MLTVEGLTVRYGDLLALDGVSLRVERGEVVALVGGNGAGKSTLLAAISGLIPITAGSIRLDGKELVGTPAHAIVTRGIIQIPEGRRLFPFMTVAENLDMGAYAVAAREHRAARLEEVLGLLPTLRERRNQLAHSLSGGEQQMCAIGRGLMAGPTLLMLDEPTLGLAPMIAAEVFGLVDAIRERGTTVLIVEQQVAKALGRADRAYVLESGRVALEGRGPELLANEELRRAYLGA